MQKRVAIVGTGPTGIYTFQNLIRQGIPMTVWLFEKGEKAGIGMPYSPAAASKVMLANIASIEIPPLESTYIDWLDSQPLDRLRAYGLDPEELDDRHFTPRLLLGEFYRDQFLALVRRARSLGFEIVIREKTEVSDVSLHDGALVLTLEKGPLAVRFDHVILATGHDFPKEDEATRSYFPSPWSGLIDAEVPPVRVGIMGTSLSAIDAAMAVANQHGRFRRHGDDLVFHAATDGLVLTLMSRSGTLPEADFYCPIPYEPLEIMTDTAVTACAQEPWPYDALFALFRQELRLADPVYAEQISLDDLTADTFPDAYFAARQAQDPFRWARRNLAEVEYNKANRITVPWRYALLRMHEKVEAIVSELPEEDRDRFDSGLKKVFVDNYAAVPSESIRRLLALRDARFLRILALGGSYDLVRHRDRTVVETEGESHEFDVFIDARGQKPLASSDLPFPTLRDALIAAEQDVPEVAMDYSVINVDGYAGRLFLGAIPYLMHDKPFVQGITACAEIGAAIATGLLAPSGGRRRRCA